MPLLNNPITLNVVDWSDDAYKEHGKPKVIATLTLEEGFKGFSYDGGRLDFNGHAETIYVSSHQFSVSLPSGDT